MIEEIRSFSGHRSLRLNGRLVASREDPIRESTRWVEFNRFRFSGRKTVFVLGVGCAYHLELIAQEHGIERVIGLELNPELFAFAKERLMNSPLVASGKIHILQIENVSTLDKKEIYAHMGSAYAVLKFFPATAISLKAYEDIFYALLGRSQKGLQLLGKARVELADELKEISSKDLISIKHITPNTKNCIWQALAELVE